jgi:hypothetical protein
LKTSAVAVALACRLVAVVVVTGCGQPVHREDYLSVSALAYDDEGDLALAARGTLIYLGSDRRERWRKEVSDEWISGLAASSSTVVAWADAPFSGPAFLVDVRRPDAQVQEMTDIRTVALAPDGRLAVQRPSSPTETQIVDPGTGSSVHITSGRANNLFFSPDGRRLYGDLQSSAPSLPPDSSSRLVAFDVRTAAELWSDPVRLRNLRLSRDGTTLVGLLADPQRSPTLLTWNAGDGTQLETFSVSTPSSTSSISIDPLAVSPDGSTIALTLSEPGRRDCRTVVIRAQVVAYSLPCLDAMEFSPDGSLIAAKSSLSSAFHEDSLIFYRSADGTELERQSFPRPFF